MTGIALSAAERGLLPLPALRFGIRRLLAKRLAEAATGPDLHAFTRSLRDSPVAVDTDAANQQHYEVPAEFFQMVLGPNLKYSGAYWPPHARNLAAAEAAMLELTCSRAQLSDGQQILELGCGWGSLTLHMARAFPRAHITAVSNSASQRRFIEARAPSNVTVLTRDMRSFDPGRRFDRVVSVEMFEHMRNLPELLRRISTWLEPDGRLFVHVFCHRSFAYLFGTEGADDWMGRHFFTGGMMPSFDLLPKLTGHLEVEESWPVNGTHYQKTARAWRENLERRKADVLPILARTYGGDAPRWFHRWRLFFLACEELFGYGGGIEWLVGHYRFRRAPGSTREEAQAEQ
jgi:cyclopropane-fatty-acyl-phospholipid synthase